MSWPSHSRVTYSDNFFHLGPRQYRDEIQQLEEAFKKYIDLLKNCHKYAQYSKFEAYSFYNKKAANHCTDMVLLYMVAFTRVW